MALKSIAWFVVKIKARIARGQGWLYYIKDIAYVFLTLYFIEDILRKFGLDNPILFRYLYIIVPIGYFIACYLIGYLDEKHGIWKMEAVYGSKNLNPFMEQIDKKIDKLIEHKDKEERI
jgi:hypothetical protein